MPWTHDHGPYGYWYWSVRVHKTRHSRNESSHREIAHEGFQWRKDSILDTHDFFGYIAWLPNMTLVGYFRYTRMPFGPRSWRGKIMLDTSMTFWIWYGSKRNDPNRISDARIGVSQRYTLDTKDMNGFGYYIKWPYIAALILGLTISGFSTKTKVVSILLFYNWVF